jgi:branched-chain amino acid transport system ATP-binding protein
MLALGRALMMRPRLLLLGEPSIGLAPRITADVFASIPRLRDAGMTIVLVPTFLGS